MKGVVVNFYQTFGISSAVSISFDQVWQVKAKKSNDKKPPGIKDDKATWRQLNPQTRMQTAKPYKYNEYPSTPRNLLSIDAHHTPRHRQSLPMYCTCIVNIIYIIHATARACHRKLFPSTFHALSTPPSNAFLPSLPPVPVYRAFQKLQEWNQLEQGRRMVKRRRNRWVGTGTGFCFPAREGASPIGSSHAHTHGYGRKAWRRLGRRKNEESRNDMRETS